MKDSPSSKRNEAPKKAATKTGKTVPASAVANVKQGIEMGMFTVKQMADSYHMTEQELKDQLGLA